jgi:hypothetical protein
MEHAVVVENIEAQARLQPYRQPGETILWTGGPDPKRLLTGKDAFLIPFSLMWGGFAIFWEASVLAFGRGPNGPPIFFMLWGIPFVVVGQYFIWGRFLVKRWDRKRTVYAVTNQRVLMLRGRSLQSIFMSQLPPIVQSSRVDGSGSLEFGSTGGSYGYAVWANSGMDLFAMGRVPLAFYDIPNVTEVYGLITRAGKPPN